MVQQPFQLLTGFLYLAIVVIEPVTSSVSG